MENLYLESSILSDTGADAATFSQFNFFFGVDANLAKWTVIGG